MLQEVIGKCRVQTKLSILCSCYTTWLDQYQSTRLWCRGDESWHNFQSSSSHKTTIMLKGVLSL